MLMQREKTLRTIVAPRGTNNFVHKEPTAPARPQNNTLVESKKIAEAKQRLLCDGSINKEASFNQILRWIDPIRLPPGPMLTLWRLRARHHTSSWQFLNLKK